INLWWEMARGDFVFYVSGPWNIGEFRHFLPPHDQDLWMTAPMPGPDGPGVSTIGGSDFVIFRASAHAELARQFIRYMLADRQQLRLYELTGDLPARRGVWHLPPLAANTKLRAFRAQLNRVRPFIAIPEWNEIMSGMRRMAARVAAGDASVRGATRRFDRTVDGWLAARRELLAHAPPSNAASAARRTRPSEAR
ncbi:ABC transporter sugar binding protein, partial [mine drainage metagenome]